MVGESGSIDGEFSTVIKVKDSSLKMVYFLDTQMSLLRLSMVVPQEPH